MTEDHPDCLKCCIVDAHGWAKARHQGKMELAVEINRCRRMIDANYAFYDTKAIDKILKPLLLELEAVR